MKKHKKKLDSVGIHLGLFETEQEMKNRSKEISGNIPRVKVGTYVKIVKPDHKNNDKIGRVVSYYEGAPDKLDHIVHFGPNNFSAHTAKDFFIFKIMAENKAKNLTAFPMPTVSEINTILAKRYKDLL